MIQQITKEINELRKENIERRKQGFASTDELVQYGIDYAKRFGALMQKLEAACK